MTVRMKCTPGWYETSKWGWLKSYERDDGKPNRRCRPTPS